MYLNVCRQRRVQAHIQLIMPSVKQKHLHLVHDQNKRSEVIHQHQINMKRKNVISPDNHHLHSVDDAKMKNQIKHQVVKYSVDSESMKFTLIYFK